MLFESDRIILRKMTSEDTELYHQWRNDIEVMQSTAPLLDVYNIKDSIERIKAVATSVINSGLQF